MIKRSFFALSQPRLHYDLLEPDPKEPESIPVPASLTLLIHEEIDSGKQALIQKGDPVQQGEKIKLYEDSTVYAISPVSGTIKLFDTYSDDFGNTATYVIITHDPAKPTEPSSFTPEETLEFADDFLRTLPGDLPFETLARKDLKIDTIVVTCSDTDILSTSNQFIACKYAEEIKKGALLLKKITGVTKLCLTLPENLDLESEFTNFLVFKTSPDYPSALPAMVMKDHLNMVPVPGKTPEEQGVCFIRPEALVSLSRVYESRKPVFEKIITVMDKTGSQRRVKAVIGTPLSKILNTFNIHVNEMDRIIIGGPMTGFATFTPHHPVVGDMDMVIVQDRDIVPELSDYPCINCGKCVRICPANVPVNILVRYLEADQYEEAADKYDLESCIECGLCAYVCTARIPLYQYIRLGKHELMSLRA
ncbi:4Fe-4S dicluster domain-containing protein [Desulfospira joergensenii]|uniref:4Fe-4S dicluster domain-containing protein n=1 Tax=Desulfospira joergensenii TaxID=53329 RepID=UPI0003B51E4F|nr:4Fe-4S dicluster domain-containing protein [Desulfospira joergensenii]